MNKLHVLPTDKPSRLHYSKVKSDKSISYKLVLNKEPSKCNDGLLSEQRNIYITSDEEIKAGGKILNPTNEVQTCIGLEKGIGTDDICWIKVKETTTLQQILNSQKIILTTDQDLIKDGVQAIDDEFLEWFVKNPSCEFVEVKHKDIIQYGNMTMHDHNGDGSYYFCTNCEVEASRSKEELLKFGVEYYKIIIPQEEPKQYPIGGYAPGYYGCTCITCKKGFTGDKRAVQCEPCAIEMVEYKPKQNSVYPVTPDECVKQESIESAAVDYISEKSERAREYGLVYSAIKFGAKWQADRMYSEEQMIEFGNFCKTLIKNNKDILRKNPNITEKELLQTWFEQFKKK